MSPSFIHLGADVDVNAYRGFPVDILEAHINGIGEALANLTERGAIEPVVKATVALSESGFVSVKEAYAFAELKDDSLTGTNSSSLFSSCLIIRPLQVS